MVTPVQVIVPEPSHNNQVTTSTNEKKPRIYYLDWLKTFLTLLVVLHHCFWVVYAGWIPFYRPWILDTPTEILCRIVLSLNQSYFMGLFFFMAGLVTVPSYHRKGLWVFVKDRFLRLMIPAILYDFLFFPLLFCFVQATWYGPNNVYSSSFGDVWKYYYDNFGIFIFHSNPMWFTVTLFTISLIVVLVLTFVKSWETFVITSHSLQGTTKSIMLLLVELSSILVLICYLLRLPFSNGVDVWIPVWGNIAFIGQYFVVFIAGILANSFQFLNYLDKKHLPITLLTSLVLMVPYILIQVVYVTSLRGSISYYGQRFIATLFEQFFAVFWSYSLLVAFKEYKNVKPSALASKIIGAAYSTYIVHQWMIIPVAIGFAYTNLHPLLVIFLLCLIGPIISWGGGLLLKAIPGSSIIL